MNVTEFNDLAILQVIKQIPRKYNNICNLLSFCLGQFHNMYYIQYVIKECSRFIKKLFKTYHSFSKISGIELNTLIICNHINSSMPRAGFKPGLRVNVYLNLTHPLTHSATTAVFLENQLFM